MMNEKALLRRKIHILLLSILIVVLVAVFYFLALKGLGIPCLFRKLTGLQCPGCGNSRAAVALLQLDFPRALRYNLLFPLEFFYLAWVFLYSCRQYLKSGRFSYQPPCLAVDITVLCLLLLWWIIRNLI